MSTYDGAYLRRNSDNGARVCSCSSEIVNDFCTFHGKYGNGGFKGSDEYKELVNKLNNKEVIK